MVNNCSDLAVGDGGAVGGSRRPQELFINSSSAAPAKTVQRLGNEIPEIVAGVTNIALHSSGIAYHTKLGAVKLTAREEFGTLISSSHLLRYGLFELPRVIVFKSCQFVPPSGKRP